LKSVKIDWRESANPVIAIDRYIEEYWKVPRRYDGEETISRRSDERFVAAVSLMGGGRRKFAYAFTRERAARK